MSLVMQSDIYKATKRVLNKIIDDKVDSAGLVYPKWCEKLTMEDAFDQDQEYAGGGLLSVKGEGTEMATVGMRQGITTVYIPVVFAARMMATEEALDDNKYPEIVNLARRLKRSALKTQEIDTSLMLMRMTNTSYVGGDGLCLANSAHTTPDGSTFSNVMATPLSPSPEAVQVAWTVTATMIGHDGHVEGYGLDKVVYPPAQHFAWATVLRSEMNPENGNFAAINVVNSSAIDKITPVSNKYWLNSTTNYGFITDAEGGLNIRFRKPMTSRSTDDFDNLQMKFSIHYRSARGWSDARGFYGVAA